LRATVNSHGPSPRVGLQVRGPRDHPQPSLFEQVFGDLPAA